jgi:predicted nucleotidyltransferase
MPRRKLEPLRVAARLADVLGERTFVIGGYAVAAWGFERATEDVDLAVDLSAAEAERRLRSAGLEVRKTRGDLRAGDIPWVLSGQMDDVPFQVMPPVLPIDWSRGREIEAEGARFKVVGLGDLLRLKLKAAGPKDFMDVTELLEAHPDLAAETRAVAEAYGVGDDLARWVKHKRPRPGARKRRK